MNDVSIEKTEAIDGNVAAAVDKGETLSSDSDEDVPGKCTPRCLFCHRPGTHDFCLHVSQESMVKTPRAQTLS